MRAWTDGQIRLGLIGEALGIAIEIPPGSSVVFDRTVPSLTVNGSVTVKLLFPNLPIVPGPDPQGVGYSGPRRPVPAERWNRALSIREQTRAIAERLVR